MSLAAKNLCCGSVLAHAERLQVIEGDENLLLTQKKTLDFWNCNLNFVLINIVQYCTIIYMAIFELCIVHKSTYIPRARSYQKHDGPCSICRGPGTMSCCSREKVLMCTQKRKLESPL
jgi:hypothetical protein